MNVASVGRPVGCLKSALRRTRLLRTFERSVSSTAVEPVPKPIPNAFSAEQRMYLYDLQYCENNIADI